MLRSSPKCIYTKNTYWKSTLPATIDCGCLSQWTKQGRGRGYNLHCTRFDSWHIWTIKNSMESMNVPWQLQYEKRIKNIFLTSQHILNDSILSRYLNIQNKTFKAFKWNRKFLMASQQRDHFNETKTMLAIGKIL